MSTLEDVLTKLSSTGRAEVTAALQSLDIDPDLKVFIGQGKKTVWPIKKTEIESIEKKEKGFKLAEESNHSALVLQV